MGITFGGSPDGDVTAGGSVEAFGDGIVAVDFHLWAEEWQDDELTYDAKGDVWRAVGESHVTNLPLIPTKP